MMGRKSDLMVSPFRLGSTFVQRNKTGQSVAMEASTTGKFSADIEPST